MARIHPTAIIEPGAELADDVEIGPYAIVGPKVRIGAGCRIASHAVIAGRTTLGRNNRVFSHAALGGEPQDKKYAGEDTELVIGDHNTIREFCTFNTGTAQDGGTTRVGSNNWIMAYVHIAHDVQVGDNCILA
jgi:UDP-N-acetylglucosamine acyltransferase